MRPIDADELSKKILEELHNRSMQGFGKGLMIANSCVINAPTIEPDPDTVSRQAVMDAIMGEPTDAHYPSWYAERIKALPPSLSRSQWIPCSERMPETRGKYIVSVKLDGHEYSDKDYWIGDRWNNYLKRQIIAWMPLPQPYKEGGAV